MSSSSGASDQSRERLIALVMLLQSAYPDSSLSQEEIVRELEVDEYPETSKGPRKTRAYQGHETAIRQKFERDKARIRDLGFEIETVTAPDGTVGYRIDPASGYAPAISFDDAEQRVVQLALSFYGFGPSGAFSVFNEGPAGDGGLEFSNFYTPVLRALNLRRTLAFGYQSSANKVRTVEPLVIDLFNGVSYLVARVKGTQEIKGYRLSRMTSMPVLLTETFDADDRSFEIAKAWRPEYSKTPTPIDMVITTNQNYATLLLRQFPRALSANKKNGRSEVGITFDDQRSALRFLLEAADRVRLQGPKSLKDDLALWLKKVNRGTPPPLESLVFAGPAAKDTLGQTLQLLHAVYAAEDGLRISDLAARFSMDRRFVRQVMDRLVSFEPMRGRFGFPAHLIKECDDWDNEESDDSTYRAEFIGGDSAAESPKLMWRDLFELNIALREASRVYTDSAIHSAIDKIEAATKAFVQVELASNESLLGDVQAAVEHHEQIKIEYTPGVGEETSVRSIEPREIRVLNGHTYARAYCTAREGWRTFRVDRINAILAKSPATEQRSADNVTNWLTQVGAEGAEVMVAMEASLRWLFESLPNVQWAFLDDGRHAAKFRISRMTFLDNLMLQAGAGAVVVTSEFTSAGHALAKRIAEQL